MEKTEIDQDSPTPRTSECRSGLNEGVFGMNYVLDEMQKREHELNITKLSLNLSKNAFKLSADDSEVDINLNITYLKHIQSKCDYFKSKSSQLEHEVNVLEEALRNISNLKNSAGHLLFEGGCRNEANKALREVERMRSNE